MSAPIKYTFFYIISSVSRLVTVKIIPIVLCYSILVFVLFECSVYLGVCWVFW